MREGEGALTRTSSTSAVDALYNFTFFKLRFRHSTDAVRAVVGVVRLNAAQTAQILIARLLPLCNQILVGYVLLYTVLVQLSADRLASVEEIKDISRLLIVYAQYRPESFCLSLPLMRVCLGFFHFLIQFIQSGFN